MVLISHATFVRLSISCSVGCYNQILWFRHGADTCSALTREKDRSCFNRHRSSSCVDTSWTYCFLRFSQKNECDRLFSSLKGLSITLNNPSVCVNFNAFFLLLVVGTVEGGRPPTKIKTDLKKPIVNLACHPRLPVFVSTTIHLLSLHTKMIALIVPSSFFLPWHAYLYFQYVAYAEGLVRAYNVQTYAVHYTLQRNMRCFVFICFSISPPVGFLTFPKTFQFQLTVQLSSWELVPLDFIRP